MSRPTRSAREWFVEAARCYTEGHQGCAWCGGSNCVYRSERADLVEYRCGECEFYTNYQPLLESHSMAPGDKRRPGLAPLTMLGLDLGK
jgi:hypothetical protein